MDKRATRRVLLIVAVTFFAVALLVGALMAADFGPAALFVTAIVGLIVAAPFAIAALFIRPPREPGALEGAVPAPGGHVEIGVYLPAATTLQPWPTARIVVDGIDGDRMVQVVRDDGEVLLHAAASDVSAKTSTKGLKLRHSGGGVQISAVSNAEAFLPNAPDKRRELHRRIDAALQGYVIADG
jgi:hypothetical protein